MSSSLHAYVSQSARGELVMGASLDPYELHSTRSTLDFAEGLAAHMLDLFPFLSEVKVNRQWAGMADMTPDFAPIMGMTPCEGFFLDAGWGTWGFKATPISGKTMATPWRPACHHPLDHRVLAGTIRAPRAHGREGRGLGGPLRMTVKLIRCPLNGPRPLLEFVCGGEVRAMPDPQTCSAMRSGPRYLFNRASVPGVKREWWCHTPSGYWFIAERDTARDEILRDLRRGRTAGEGRRHDVSPAARRRRVDRSVARARVRVRRARVQGLRRRHASRSALAAAGVMTLGRSFKYHRPRGISSFANHDANNLFQVAAFVRIGAQCARRRHAARRWHARDRREHRRRTRRAIARASSNGWRRFCRWASTTRRFTASAFRAGSGEFAPCPDSGASPRMRRARARPSAMRSATCWSLAPARAVSRPRCRPPMRAHACCWWMKTRARAAADAGVAPPPARSNRSSIEWPRSPSIELLTSTYAAGYYADHWVALVEPTRMTKVRAGAVVFATGVIEQPAVFRNNDLPGVMSGSAAQRLLHRHGIAPGKRVAILTANREGYELARELRAHGIAVAAVLDLRAGPGGDAYGLGDLRCVAGVIPQEAIAGRGGAVRALRVRIGRGRRVRRARNHRLRCGAHERRLRARCRVAARSRAPPGNTTRPCSSICRPNYRRASLPRAASMASTTTPHAARTAAMRARKRPRMRAAATKARAS